MQIDSHTLGEVNELFLGWKDFPPTNLLLKGLIEGLSGGGKTSPSPELRLEDIPPEAFEEMQKSALAGIAAKADPRLLPIVRGKDRGLPKAAPVFDLEEMRRRNMAVGKGKKRV